MWNLVCAADQIMSTCCHAQTNFGACTSTAERRRDQQLQRRMPQAGVWQLSSQSRSCPVAARSARHLDSEPIPAPDEACDIVGSGHPSNLNHDSKTTELAP
jgi:hypothetical protein